MKGAYDKVVSVEETKPSSIESKKGFDNPAMFSTIIDQYFVNKEKQAEKFRKGDWSNQDKPHRVQDEYHQLYYSSPVKNSHQYPREIKIRPPTFDTEIKPKTTSFFQKRIDNEPVYVGLKKYTRTTLPYHLEPIWK